MRTMNETHGQIQANVSIDGGHPIPLNVTVYQARTVNGTKFVSFVDDDKILIESFFLVKDAIFVHLN